MKNIEELPLVEFLIEDEASGLFGVLGAISIVTSPATEKLYELFKEAPIVKSDFRVTNEDKMEITGPIMVPNKKILRYNEEKKEYFNCFFSEQTIKKCAEYYLKNLNHTKVNFEHGDNFTDSVYMTETWFVEDPKLDKSAALNFKEVDKGTWFGTFKVSDPNLWAELKKSDFSGFSVEGDFIYNTSLFSSESEMLSKIELIVDDASLSKEEKKQAIKLILGSN